MTFLTTQSSSGSRKDGSKMTPKMIFLWERIKFSVVFESLSLVLQLPSFSKPLHLNLKTVK